MCSNSGLRLLARPMKSHWCSCQRTAMANTTQCQNRVGGSPLASYWVRERAGERRNCAFSSCCKQKYKYECI